MHRKLLVGAIALVVPAGTLVAFGSPAFAKKPVPNPIHCTGFGPTITFGNPLSKNGVATASKLANATSVSSSTVNCGGGTANGHSPSLSIPGGKNSKLSKSDPRYVKKSAVKYVTGTQASFVSSGGKSVKKGLKIINFTINGQGVQFKLKRATEVIGGACPGEVGFVLAGQVKVGTYNTKTASVTACIGPDSGPGTVNSFGVDLFSPSATVDTAQIDPATSNATL